MPTSRRNVLLIIAGFSAFVFAQYKSGKSQRLYPGDLTLTQLDVSDDDWKQRLNNNAYQVLRQGNTENRHSSPLNTEIREGRYHCKGCDLPLFESHMKYDSQTGWPSFNNHIHGHLSTYTDLKSFPPARAYRCVRCKGHQGHLFMDGPLPSGERWCNNGAALKFIPA